MNEAAKQVIGTSGAAFSKPLPGDGAHLRLQDTPIEGFRSGACLDLRVRVALEFITHNPNFGPLYNADGNLDPGLTATFALDAATKLIEIAQARGLIEPLDNEQSKRDLEGHAARQVTFQLYAQKEGTRQAEEGNRIHKAVSKAFNQ